MNEAGVLGRFIPPFGRIVAIGSVQEARPNPSHFYYAATKAALQAQGFGTLTEIDEERWRRSWDLKVFGAFRRCPSGPR
mgnify:CR=1 FL=1